jgi:anti-sigma regulatory factor (Ser/Thr protein kinase)
MFGAKATPFAPFYQAYQIVRNWSCTDMMPRPPVICGAAAESANAAAPPALPSRVILPAAPVIRVLPGAPESAAAARQLTRQLLGDDHPAADTAMLLMSELVTNSVMHSRSRRPGGTVTIAVCAGPASVLIQVRDDGGPFEPQLPRASGEAAPGAEHGYGLLLVDALAETWGTSATTDGRVTWCRLAINWLDEGTRRRCH